MKRIFNIIICLLIIIPFINVNALSCRGETKETAIDLKNISSFSCSDINGDKLTFTNNGNDITKYFELRDDKSTIDILDSSLTFTTEIEFGIVNISDGTASTNIFIKNAAYVAPTTTTTTITKDASIKTLTVTLDPNDGGEVTTKTCDVNSVNTTCSITLPKIDKETFNGWGTASTCKEGNKGTIRVDKDIKYYACYTDNENTNSDSDAGNDEDINTVLLKTLSLTNKDTGDVIEFGTFSIKNTKYDFKVLNSVENIDVKTTTDEGINVEIIGNENLKVGDNKILIKLTDENNKQNEYTLNVTRLKEGETLNTVHYLKSLVVGGYEINFDKEKLVYGLTIPSNVNKLEITALAEEEKFVPEILNNENLVDGSQVKINITDEYDNTTSYIINITKESSMNYLLIGAIGLIVLLIIILIILIIVKSNKKKSGQQNKKTGNDIEVLNI